LNAIESVSKAKLAASYQSFAYVSFWPNAPVQETTAFDEKAELHEFELGAQKLTLATACRKRSRQPELQQLR